MGSPITCQLWSLAMDSPTPYHLENLAMDSPYQLGNLAMDIPIP